MKIGVPARGDLAVLLHVRACRTAGTGAHHREVPEIGEVARGVLAVADTQGPDGASRSTS